MAIRQGQFVDGQEKKARYVRYAPNSDRLHVSLRIVARCHKETPQQTVSLFDHFVGSQKHSLDWRIAIELPDPGDRGHPWSAASDEQLHGRLKPFVVVYAAGFHKHDVRRHVWFCGERRSAPRAAAAPHAQSTCTNVLEDRRFTFNLER